MVTAPHHLAAQAGLDVLREGGTAIEAAVAALATIAVAYPHMNGIGGDNFWLIREPGSAPLAIDASGRAAQAASVRRYREAGWSEMPARGPWAASTVAGAVSGWQLALEIGRRRGAKLPLARLLRDAVHYAANGVPVCRGMTELLRAKHAELAAQPGFAAVFLDAAGAPLAPGSVLRQPALAAVLEALGRNGLHDFYAGEVAAAIAEDLRAVGSPLSADDLAAHRAVRCEPLSANVRGARLFNVGPPTQGVASLMILALFDRLGVAEADGFEHVHGLVECTKRAFELRDAEVGDPAYMRTDVRDALTDERLDALAAGIDMTRAAPWPTVSNPGDTVWLGCVDRDGCAVSVIQSVYFEFGSGVVLPSTGIVWQNRGSSFRLAETGWNALRPGRKPFHTLNPAMAEFADGRIMCYGTMGGDGQPQTQAAVFSRYAMFGREPQQAVTAPRWLLGRTWGAASTTLKLEDRFAPDVVRRLEAAGHEVEIVAPFTSIMGHAGAIVQHADGLLEGASDPRSDGAVAAF